jgi:hypothetical protein
MAPQIVLSKRDTWLRSRADGRSAVSEDLRLADVPDLLAQGERIAVWVEGWREPWPCVIVKGKIRATCPTVPGVTLAVVER